MAKQFRKVGEAVLFPNDKGGVDDRPDFRGNIKLTDMALVKDAVAEGKEMKLSAWKRRSKKGTPMMTMSIQVQVGEAQQTNSEPQGEQQNLGTPEDAWT